MALASRYLLSGLPHMQSGEQTFRGLVVPDLVGEDNAIPTNHHQRAAWAFMNRPLLSAPRTPCRKRLPTNM